MFWTEPESKPYDKVIKSMTDLLENDMSYENITETFIANRAEIFLTILAYHKKFGKGISKLSALVQMVNSWLTGSILPGTIYKLDLIFNDACDVTFHGTCPKCHSYFGKYEDLNDINECKNSECKEKVDFSKPSSDNFFAILNPSRQIVDLLSTHREYYDYVVNRRVYNEEVISDIYDGRKYRELLNKLSPEERKG